MTDEKPEDQAGAVNWRMGAGYALMGLGGSLGFAGVGVFRSLFTSGRFNADRPPLLKFDIHHPAVIATLALAGVGLALFITGLFLAFPGRGAAVTRPPLSFGDDDPDLGRPPPPPPLRGPPPP